MSYNDSEDFVADFREALDDLQMNNRYDIQNLTMIARENTEHALAISQALQDHIKRVAPHKKLPSLYVLDSIVKNVGTPYTLFFGKKLYDTYMDSYASVDNNTRRKMDEMLKTWREPVPGSLDNRPVFPPEVTRPIENALLKVRTATANAQQRHYRSEQQLLGRGRAMEQEAVPYRETPTPPGVRPSSQASGYPGGPLVPGINGNPYAPPTQPPPQYPPYQNQQIPARSTPQPMANLSAFQPPFQGGYGVPQPGISVDALKDDIQKLITSSKADFARNPHDPGTQTKLKALLDLQSILQTQNLPQDQLMLIKNRIAELAVTIRGPPAQTSTPVSIAPPVAVAPPPASAPPKVSIDALLGTGALAALLARGSATPQVSAPQPSPAVAAIRSPPPSQRVEPQRSATPSQPDPQALLNMLRKAGMLPGPAPANVSTPAPSANMPLSVPLPVPPPLTPAMGASTLGNLTRDIVFKASSLKQFRPHLLPLLFEALGPQCSQCGRRFKSDEEGKQKKMAHMDWHFKVNQRIADTEKKGQHRSWFVDEMDWIKTRETIDEDHVALAHDPTSIEDAASKKHKVQYLPVPDDPMLANSVCPICQEKFETKWLDEAQEFVWPDAIRIGDRIYHASCHKEATGGSAVAALYARSTPEPVLGKRKAENDLPAGTLRGRTKVEA